MEARHLANAIGLAALAGLVWICATLVPSALAPTPLFFFGYLTLAAMGLYAWHSDKFPWEPQGWLLLTLGSVVAGASFFGVDILIGHHRHPGLSWADLAMRSGGLDIVLAAGACFVALAGAAGSACLTRRE